MTNYLIYRHGANAANQSMTPVMAIDIVAAKNKQEAIAISKGQITCYNNQFLSAVAESKANKTDWFEAATEIAIREIEKQVSKH